MTLKKRLQCECLEQRECLASDWQNMSLVCDVDRSSTVTPMDALVVINQLNRDGAHDLPSRPTESVDPYFDVSGDRYLTPLDALMVLNSLNRYYSREPSVVSGLSPASDPNNNGVVQLDRVVINGHTLENAKLEFAMDGIDQPFASSVADDRGAFSIELPIADGLHTILIEAHDELGRKAETSLDIRRGNAIQDWNAAVLDVVRQWTTISNDPYQGRIVTAQPPLVARNLAMIHAAMFDAVNAVAKEYTGYRFNPAEPIDASADAAAATAAFDVASSLYSAPDEIAIWQASLEEVLSQVVDSQKRDLGIELGHRAARAILEDRKNDGVKSSSNYSPSLDVGNWRRTFPDFLPPLLPQWPNVKPFALSHGDSMRPAPPPSLDSPEYAAAVEEVMRLGSFESSDRTEEQTEIALFWADGGGTATPPGHWNRIAQDVTLQKGSNLVETARTFALLNIAMADAGIASWDAKYSYDLWRPIDAIRQADHDGNVATESDPTWFPLLKTPPFPTYTSGHSTFSGAASAVLAELYGDATQFDSQADGHSAPEERPLDSSQIVTRHFLSFSQAAQEAGMSRIYGGIHFSFDNTAGLELGKRIGTMVTQELLKSRP